ncbi:hypothetical protein HDV03_003611 [Kappamyces sp. JEL0829]|nr:hypothetical protein HDV03_003611 [Kappamyces sp. JEL0829]
MILKHSYVAGGSHDKLAFHSLYLVMWTVWSGLEWWSVPFYWHIKSLVICHLLFNRGFEPIYDFVQPLVFSLQDKKD